MGKAAKAGTPVLDVEVVPIDSLTLDPRNARKHGSRNLDAGGWDLNSIGCARCHTLCPWEDWAAHHRRRQPWPRRVRRVVYRASLTGMDVEVLVPTLWGRLCYMARQVREAGR